MRVLYIIFVSSLLANSHGNQMTPICHHILIYWTPYISLANQFKIHGCRHPPYFSFSNCTFAFTLTIFFCRDYICLLSLIDHLSSLASTHHVMPPFSNPIHPPNCHLTIAPICNPSIVNWKKLYSTTQMATTQKSIPFIFDTKTTLFILWLWVHLVRFILRRMFMSTIEHNIIIGIPTPTPTSIYSFPTIA